MSALPIDAHDLPDGTEVVDSDTNIYVKDAGWHGLWSCSDGDTVSTGDVNQMLANGGSVLRRGGAR